MTFDSTSPSTRIPQGRAGSLRAFAAENGYFLTMQKVLGAVVRRRRDRLLAARLKTHGVRIGRHPKFGGLAFIRMGENFSAGDGLWLDAITSFAGHTYNPVLTIGANCNVSNQVHVACTNRVAIGDGLLCGSNVVITDHAHGIYQGAEQTSPHVRPVERPLSADGVVRIGRNVWIGDGSAILAGAQIGDGAIIGANSVVNGVVEAATMVAGAPARLVRRWDEGAGKWLRT